ncbi:MAG TPA: diadenylate cyclase CdaA [Candidatus Dormibacteraeota bacterium]|nr:diadenylate cyclase CdaA [Candidatus Dormibacteraeota bacterium]
MPHLPAWVLAALDVLATSVLIYYLLLLIRGTRAVQIMLGLLTLVAVMAIANMLELVVLKTLLQYLVLGTAFTLPIVFQPELRRALERIGRGEFFHVPQGEAAVGVDLDGVVEALVRAAIILSRSEIGALVVVEQQSGLQEFVESGTRLDAKLTPELLLTIFTPRAPLHDGAVIVRGDRIVAAGCFLPLTETMWLDRRLGTRHRAAIGLTEQTDAVALVVSEETGNIAVARSGRLSRELADEERLRKVLRACLHATGPSRYRMEGVVAALRQRLRVERGAQDRASARERRRG